MSDPFADHAALRDLLDGVALPAALVDLDAFDRNVEHVAGIARDEGLTVRLASKSVRVPALLRRAMDHAPSVFVGLMCFSVAEAELLAGSSGFDELLIAYPTLRREELAPLRELHDGGARVSLVVDSPAGIAALAEAMAGATRPFPVVVEVDASWRPLGGRVHAGVRRSPVRSDADLRAVAACISRHPQLRLLGAMSYEAQVAGLPDANPDRRAFNRVARFVRRRSMRSLDARRAQLLTTLEELTSDDVELLINAGGSGSLNWTAADHSVTELTAGSALLCGHIFDRYTNIAFEPSLHIALQVVRASDPGFVTLQGGGYGASGAPGRDRLVLPTLPRGLRLLPDEGGGEVQTPVRVPLGTALEPGDPVLVRPAKSGEPLERFAEVLLVAGGAIVDRAPTYRGLGLTTF